MTPEWLTGLSHKDWLFDGHPIRGERMLDQFAKLDWGNAHVDLGPSPTGNLGPYWHVPLHYKDDEFVHRLYPKIPGKWLHLIRRACEEIAERAARHSA